MCDCSVENFIIYLSKKWFQTERTVVFIFVLDWFKVLDGLNWFKNFKKSWVRSRPKCHPLMRIEREGHRLEQKFIKCS